MAYSSRRFTVPATTDGTGAATVYSPYFSGFIQSIQYVKTDFANGVDFTITADEAGDSIVTLGNQDTATISRPRWATQSTAGVESRYVAGDALSVVRDKVALGRDRVKIVIASGGDTKTGAFVITVSDRR